MTRELGRDCIVRNDEGHIVFTGSYEGCQAEMLKHPYDDYELLVPVLVQVAHDEVRQDKPAHLVRTEFSK